MTNADIFKRLLVCCVAAWLSACGGGGGGGSTQTETLYVSFVYPDARPNVRAPMRSTPEITGLKGHAPRCTLTAGTLPAGVTLDASTCVVSGTPATAGTFVYYVRLTASGVEGSVDSEGLIIVSDPTPILALGEGLHPSGPYYPALSLQYAQALAERPLVLLDYTYTPQAGDVVSFAVTGGALPSGISLDTATGTIRGTPTGYGTSDVSVRATLVRGGVTYMSEPVTVSMAVSTTIMQGRYGVCIFSVAIQGSCSLLEIFGASPGVTVAYLPGTLPSGFSVDPSSGAIFGSSNTIDDLAAQVVVRYIYPDGSVLDTTTPVLLRVFGQYLFYEPNANNFGLASGPGASPYPGTSTGVQLTPGVSFGIYITYINGVASGDVSVFTLEPLEGAMSLPAWLNIDPNTGQVFGIPPANAAPLLWKVKLTTLRGGMTYVTSLNWAAWFQ